jgi:hypothetical protein
VSFDVNQAMSAVPLADAALAGLFDPRVAGVLCDEVDDLAAMRLKR